MCTPGTSLGLSLSNPDRHRQPDKELGGRQSLPPHTLPWICKADVSVFQKRQSDLFVLDNNSRDAKLV